MIDVQKYLKLFAASESGAWMKAFEWQKVSIELLPFRVEGIATAAYCALSDRIRVAPDKEDSVFFSCVVHELRHAFQRRQMGLIAYLLTKTFRRSALERFVSLPEGKLEQCEKLEQLRALENGMRIKVIVTPHSSIGIDTPEELKKAEAYLASLSTKG